MTTRMKSLVVVACVLVAATAAEADWRPVLIQGKAAGTYTPLFVNVATNYSPIWTGLSHGHPNFQLMAKRGNATIYIGIRGVTWAIFEDFMNKQPALPTPFPLPRPYIDLTYTDAAGVTLDMLLSTNFNLVYGKLVEVTVSVRVKNGRQTNVDIRVFNGKLTKAQVKYGRPAIVLPNAPQYGAGYDGLVKVMADNNIGVIKVWGGVVHDCRTSKNIGYVLCTAKNDKKFGLKYGGIIGGNVFAAGDIRFVACNNGIGSLVRPDGTVRVALKGQICAGWNGTAPSQGNIWRVNAAGGANNNSIITAGSNPAGNPGNYQYAGQVYSLAIGTQEPCVNLTVVSRAKTIVRGKGAGAATGNIITSVGTFPL